MKYKMRSLIFNCFPYVSFMDRLKRKEPSFLGNSGGNGEESSKFCLFHLSLVNLNFLLVKTTNLFMPPGIYLVVK